ncbi:MAG: matrixin family metalloprotease [Gammaproteobacteria bacterium]
MSRRHELTRVTVFISFFCSWGLTFAQDLDATTAQEHSALAPLAASDEITYFISEGSADSKYRAADRELAEWALEAWERSAKGALRFSPGPESSALLRVYWVPANFGLYGEMRPILVDGERGAAVYIRPDTEALGEQIAKRSREDSLFRDAVVYLTCLHELGHALGLEHTAEFADIMYFFGFGGDIPGFFGRYRDELHIRDNIADVAGLSEGDLEQLQTLYGIR